MSDFRPVTMQQHAAMQGMGVGISLPGKLMLSSERYGRSILYRGGKGSAFLETQVAQALKQCKSCVLRI